MNTREVTKKIKSVSNVKKITKAMQLVSAVKMKKAQQVALEGKPYQQFLQQAIERLTSGLKNAETPLLNPKTSSQKTLVIVVTADKGLCGSFNTNVLRFLIKNVTMNNAEFITVGKKGATILSHLGGKVIADFSAGANDEVVSAVFTLALSKYLDGTYSKVFVAYNTFVNTLRSDPTLDKLLPFSLEQFENKETMPKTEADYTVEPNPAQIMDTLLRNYIEEKLRFSVWQSEAGEHSARMIAMKNATDNASEVILNLTSLKNKLRQQKITYELLDMITAKESVEIN